MPALKTILRLNATSCLGFGVLFLLFPNTVAAYLGAPPAPGWLISTLGGVLVLNGVHLLHTGARTRPPKVLVLYFSIGDFAWVVGTFGLVLSGLWITRPEGQLVALIVAAFVGAMGILQVWACRGAPGRPEMKRR